MTMQRLDMPVPRIAGERHLAPRRGARAAGFSLMEVLVAMGLLALGFVAVAAIFPTGAVLQREAAHEAQTRNMRTNVEATIRGTGLTHEALHDNYMYEENREVFSEELSGYDYDYYRDFDLRPMRNHDDEYEPLHLQDDDVAFWPIGARSVPASQSPTSHPELIGQRPFQWVPLLRHRGGPNADAPQGPTAPDRKYFKPEWEITVFVLRRHYGSDESPPDYVGRYLDGDYPAINAAWTPGDWGWIGPAPEFEHWAPRLTRVGVADVADDAQGNRRRQFVFQNAVLLRLGDEFADSLGRHYQVVGLPEGIDEDGLVDTVDVDTRIGRANPAYERDEYIDDPDLLNPDAIWYAPRAEDSDRDPVHAIFTIRLPVK